MHPKKKNQLSHLWKKNIYEKKTTHAICLKLRLPSQAWLVPPLVIYSNRFKLYLTLQLISLQKFLGRERGVQMIFTEMIDARVLFISYERHVGERWFRFPKFFGDLRGCDKGSLTLEGQRHAGLNHTHTMPCFFFRAALWTRCSNFPFSTQAVNRREALRSAVLQRRLFKMLTCCHGRCSGLWAKRKMRVIPTVGSIKPFARGKRSDRHLYHDSVWGNTVLYHTGGQPWRDPKEVLNSCSFAKRVCTDMCVCVFACIHIHMCTCVPWCMCGGQRKTCRMKFSFYHIFPEMEFRSSLATSSFTDWAISLAQCARF